MSIQSELTRRQSLWQHILDQGSVAYGVSPTKLRELEIYGGQQGIWIDKKRTGSLSHNGYGIAVSALYKGDNYPDDLDETGAIYHYPKTDRPSSRDIGEIEAVKNCQRYDMPIFVIRVSPENKKLRDVFFGFVTMWDDDAEVFIVEFGESPDIGKLQEQDAPFQVREKRRSSPYIARIQRRRVAFRIAVLRRYGLKCAVCDVSVVELLDAAHLVPKSEFGTDDPRNGVVLCALHHRAFDRGLFAIEPETLRIVQHPNGPTLERMGVVENSISHLPQLPHEDAIRAAWETWEKTCT